MKDSNCTIRQGNQYTGINITGKKQSIALKKYKIDIDRTQCLSAIIQQRPDQYFLTPPPPHPTYPLAVFFLLTFFALSVQSQWNSWKRLLIFFVKYYKGLEHRRDFLWQENHTTYKGTFPKYQKPEKWMVYWWHLLIKLNDTTFLHLLTR